MTALTLLAPSERDGLVVYRHRVERLKACSFWISVQSAHYTMDVSRGSDGELNQVQTSTTGPTDAELAQLLIEFRHFYMNDSAANFNRTCNILYQVFSDASARQAVAQLRELYRSLMKRPDPSGLARGDQPVTPESVLDQWINGVYFHHDQAKAQPVQDWDVVAPGLYRFVLIDAVADLGMFVISLDELVAVALQS